MKRGNKVSKYKKVRKYKNIGKYLKASRCKKSSRRKKAGHNKYKRADRCKKSYDYWLKILILIQITYYLMISYEFIIPKDRCIIINIKNRTNKKKDILSPVFRVDKKIKRIKLKYKYLIIK